MATKKKKKKGAKGEGPLPFIWAIPKSHTSPHAGGSAGGQVMAGEVNWECMVVAVATLVAYG